MDEKNTQKMHAEEVSVNKHLVERLIATQFPEWADLELERTRASGTDNVIYRLGEELAVRMPKIYWAVGQVEKEWAWISKIAPHVRVEIPEPVAKGEGDLGYPHKWLVYRWIKGTDLEEDPNIDHSRLARDLASFVLALREVPIDGAPSFGRTLEEDEPGMLHYLQRLEGPFDKGRVLEIWNEAIKTTEGPPVWLHGDLLPGNLLHREGRLSGVIDWGASGLGDPSRELMVAWAMPKEARNLYRTALDVDDGTWRRAKGWVISQCVMYIPYYADTIPAAVEGARRRLACVLESDDA